MPNEFVLNLFLLIVISSQRLIEYNHHVSSGALFLSTYSFHFISMGCSVLKNHTLMLYEEQISYKHTDLHGTVLLE